MPTHPRTKPYRSPACRHNRFLAGENALRDVVVTDHDEAVEEGEGEGCGGGGRGGREGARGQGSGVRLAAAGAQVHPQLGEFFSAMFRLRTYCIGMCVLYCCTWYARRSIVVWLSNMGVFFFFFYVFRRPRPSNLRFVLRLID